MPVEKVKSDAKPWTELFSRAVIEMLSQLLVAPEKVV